jgi:hypothetical protein
MAMKPKRNYKAETSKPSPYDNCQTPPYALEALYPYLPRDKVIWESCAGMRNIVNAFHDHGYERVIGTDIVRNPAYDFMSWEPGRVGLDWDIQVTNPPYGIKYKWLKRSYELGKPFALLVPCETIGSDKGQRLIEEYGFEQLLLDTRIDFYMPNKGYLGKGSQFPVFWLCWKLLPEQVVYGRIKQAKREFQRENSGRGIIQPVSEGLGSPAPSSEEAGRNLLVEMPG